MKVFLETSEVADQLGVGVRQVLRLAKQGMIPHIRRGRRIRIPAAAWASFIAQQSAEALNSLKGKVETHAKAA